MTFNKYEAVDPIKSDATIQEINTDDVLFNKLNKLQELKTQQKQPVTQIKQQTPQNFWGDINTEFVNNDGVSLYSNIEPIMKNDLYEQLLLSASDFSKSGKFFSHSRGWTDLGHNNYKKLCTSGPETFYREAGKKMGIDLDLKGLWWNTGHPRNATGTNITKKGFDEIWSGSADDVKEKKMQDNLHIGDIMLIYGNYKKTGKPSAHAMMWNGENWVSDTVQDHAWVYGEGRLGNRSAVIYRLNKNKI